MHFMIRMSSFPNRTSPVIHTCSKRRPDVRLSLPKGTAVPAVPPGYCGSECLSSHTTHRVPGVGTASDTQDTASPGAQTLTGHDTLHPYCPWLWMSFAFFQGGFLDLLYQQVLLTVRSHNHCMCLPLSSQLQCKP